MSKSVMLSLSKHVTIQLVSDLLANLNDQQKQAVCHTQGLGLVLAGAGSGKTKVLTTRAAWLIANQAAQPDQILLVTFTNKAASQMRERIQKLTSYFLPFVGTFHSLCSRILRQNGDKIGLNRNFVIYDSDDQLAAIKLVYKELGIDPKILNQRVAHAWISRAKNELLSPNAYAQVSQNFRQEMTSKIYRQYQKKLLENQAVDFDDLLTKTIELLQKNSTVLKQYQQQFQHVLVDEYQDTNKAQYELTRLLAKPQDNLFVVGDFSQSIYAWRGADYRNIVKLQTDFPEYSQYKLEQNYRSNQTILDAASHIIASNTSHPTLKLWTNNQKRVPITLYLAKNGYREASQIAKWIKKENRITPLKQMAILYRTNAQSRIFEEIFLSEGIPHKIVGGFAFYERKEIKDLLNYLRLVINPNDEISLGRSAKTGKRKLKSLIDWVNNKQSLLSMTEPLTLIEEIIKVTNYIDSLDENVPDDVSRLDNIEELKRVAAQFASITEFLENIALIQDGYLKDATTQKNDDATQLMSLHSAKGLEFEVVFLVGLEEGLFPHSRSLTDPDQLEEERRLCYVGITRAKRKLYLSYAQSRNQYGQTTYSTPSRFIGELPPQLFEKKPSTIKQNFDGLRLVKED